MRFKIQIPVNLSRACPQEKLKGTVALQIMKNNTPFYLHETPYRESVIKSIILSFKSLESLLISTPRKGRGYKKFFTRCPLSFNILSMLCTTVNCSVVIGNIFRKLEQAPMKLSFRDYFFERKVERS